MKRLIMTALMAVTLVGCANDPNASDYELCQAMSGRSSGNNLWRKG